MKGLGDSGTYQNFKSKISKGCLPDLFNEKNTSNHDHGSQMSNLLGIVPYQRLRLLRILTLDLWMTKERKKRLEDQL